MNNTNRTRTHEPVIESYEEVGGVVKSQYTKVCYAFPPGSVDAGGLSYLNVGHEHFSRLRQ